MRWLKRLGWVGLLLVLGVALGCYAWLNARTPQRDGNLPLAGLSQAVDVRYDAWGVPHIEARNELDAMRALGFVHAQDRLFQMDLLRRKANGRLSALFGPQTLDSDVLFRTLGLRAAAERYAAQMARQPDAVSRATEAYVAGINAYIAQGRLPVEYTLLRAQPEPFTVADVASIGGLLAYGFSQGFQEDVLLSNLAARLSPAYFDDFTYDWPGASVRPRAVVKPRAPVSEPAPAPTTEPETPASAAALLPFARSVARVDAGFPIPQLMGSNAWLIDGKHSASGKPLLANDPHIGFAEPAVWYEAHVKTPQWEVYGHFLAGVPMPLLHHNRLHAVGLTMWENDEVDFFLLRKQADHPGQVLERGHWVQLTERAETIEVKGGQPVTLHIPQSVYGPVINGAYPELKQAEPIAAAWTYLDPKNQPLHSLYAIAHARNLEEMQQAAALHVSPGLNLAYADTDGHIALWAIGRQTVRPTQVNSHRIQDGASPHAWMPQLAPFSTNPRVIDPPEGVIYSANNPYPDRGRGIVAGYYPAPDRVNQLASLLAPRPAAWTVADMQRIQADQHNPATATLCQEWRALLDPAQLNEEERKALTLLEGWKGDYGADRQAPTLCERWRLTLIDAIFADELSSDELTLLKKLFLLDKSLPAITRDAQSRWWNDVTTPQQETRPQRVLLALQQAVASLSRQLGNDPQQWHWGRLHTLTHGHALGTVKLLSPIFDVGPFPVGGGRDSLDNQYFRFEADGFPVRSGPSTRRIVDLSDPAGAIGINPVGQSGVLLDRHHHDQAALYLAHRYRPMWLDEADVTRHAEGVLRLEPAATP